MVAVTGSNGLVGSFIIKKLVETGSPVTGLVRPNGNTALWNGVSDKILKKEVDILDTHALTESLDGAETVIHTAGYVSFSPRKSARIYEVNVTGTKNIVNACLMAGVKKLIHISSVAALGRKKGTSHLDEESRWVPGSLNTTYAESKYQAELEVYRGMEEGLPAIIICPSAVLAAADWTRSSSRLFEYVWRERFFYPTGSINYIDARDLADITVKLISNSTVNQKFIASGGSISYQNLFSEISQRFQKKPPAFKLGKKWASALGRLEEMKSILMQTDPLITRTSALIASESFHYINQKVVDHLGFKFHSIADTLDWCCDHFKGNVTTNK
jgi:dihydroflavonol-4-reductase